jgi:UDP-N-acetylglucosamine--N-acetylmuramyl-(pentapeptide) pyrophosphoryl-undecaprenol N-acetylglucosamine transferase
MKALNRVVIMAGGTGGHVFPGIALAQAFAERGIACHWLGTQGGMEAHWVSQAQIPFSAISIKGLRGNGLKGWLLAPIKVWRAFLQARRILKQQAPELVIGMGGFVCGPGGLAARSLGIPLILHEQNAIAGLTNRLLAPLARYVFCGFEQTSLRGENVEVIGNPVRAEIEAVTPLSAPLPRHILVIGGSRGARALNETVPQALANIATEQRPSVVHQTGQADVAATQARYQALGVAAEVVPFIDNMAQAYQQAGLVIARSGALTVSELMCAGRPAILVPFPFAVDDHQTANAQVMVELEAATLIQQNVLDAQILEQAIRDKLDHADSIAASQRLYQAAQRHAAQRLVERVTRLI